MGRRYFVPSSLRGRHRTLLRNQVADLILYESLTTTEVRAKALKVEIERFISRAKRSDLVTRRRVLAFLPKEAAVGKFFEQIIPQFQDRVGGYVRVVKLLPRRGDNAPMARVEFVEKIAGGADARGTKGARLPARQGKTRKEKPSAAKAGKEDKRPKAKGKAGGKSAGKRKKVPRGSA